MGGQVGGAYVRIRPTLAPEEREALTRLASSARALADGLDTFLSRIPAPPELEEETHD
jgi:hypothetical protein